LQCLDVWVVVVAEEGRADCPPSTLSAPHHAPLANEQAGADPLGEGARQLDEALVPAPLVHVVRQVAEQEVLQQSTCADCGGNLSCAV